jgi:hypothetical protein
VEEFKKLTNPDQLRSEAERIFRKYLEVGSPLPLRAILASTDLSAFRAILSSQSTPLPPNLYDGLQEVVVQRLTSGPFHSFVTNWFQTKVVGHTHFEEQYRIPDFLFSHAVSEFCQRMNGWNIVDTKDSIRFERKMYEGTGPLLSLSLD